MNIWLYILEEPRSVSVVNKSIIKHSHHLMHPQSENKTLNNKEHIYLYQNIDS